MATPTQSGTSSKTPSPSSTHSTSSSSASPRWSSPRGLQQEQLSRRGRKHDPLYKIRNILRDGIERLIERQIECLGAGLEAGDPGCEVTVAWRCYQQLRSAYHAKNLTEGGAIAVKIVDGFHTCPIPEIARWGALRAWKQLFLGCFTTSRSNDGGTEASVWGNR